MENVSEIILGILFVAGEPIAKADIAEKLNIDEDELNSAIADLKVRFGGTCGISLIEFNNKLQLSSNSAYGEQISLVLNPIRERNLSKATLETIAIIAYKQPITRLEIEEIRGVGCDYAISILMEHNLIEVVGRKDAVGRPVMFGTTDEFLKRFNLNSIDDLPDYNELLEKIAVVRANQKDALYNDYEVPTDKIEHDEDAKSSLKDGSEKIILNKTKNAFNDIISDGEDEFV